MSTYRITSRADDGWGTTSAATAPGLHRGRVVRLAAPVLRPGPYKWLSHPKAFLVTPAQDRYHHQLAEHMDVEAASCTCGILEVEATARGSDVVFSTYDIGPKLTDDEISDRLEHWLRAGAPLALAA